MIDAREAANAEWAALSFIELDYTALEGALKANFWVPVVSGDWAADCDRGRGYAAETARYLERTGDVTIMPRIVGAMPRGDNMGGVETGFLSAMAAAFIEAPDGR